MCPHSSKSHLSKKVFLSSTFQDLSYHRDIAAEVLTREGYKVIRSEDLNFARGSGAHKHDICLQRVDETPNFLLIIDWYAGRPYKGANPDYDGLTITHAEAKRAFRKKSGWHCFAKQDVIIAYNIWKQNKRLRGFKHKPVERKVFYLLNDIDKQGKWTLNAFNDPVDFKRKLKKYFRQLR
jgi:hypothetical protein